MKIAVASLGIVPDALVGIRFGFCSQFLVFDLDTMGQVVHLRRQGNDRH